MCVRGVCGGGWLVGGGRLLLLLLLRVLPLLLPLPLLLVLFSIVRVPEEDLAVPGARFQKTAVSVGFSGLPSRSIKGFRGLMRASEELRQKQTQRCRTFIG